MMARYSLNEIDGMARKAARGAGMPWGLAEEAGKAARWLCERGWPGLTLLLDVLTHNDGARYVDIRPVPAGEVDGIRRWAAEGDALCPIACGAALNDIAGRILEDDPIRLEGAREPLLLAPFLGRAAADLGRGFELRDATGAAAIRLHPEGPEVLAPVEGGVLIVAPCSAAPGSDVRPRHLCGVTVEDAVWRTAEALAHRTYVPASEESRLSGAGAGVGDND